MPALRRSARLHQKLQQKPAQQPRRSAPVRQTPKRRAKPKKETQRVEAKGKQEIVSVEANPQPISRPSSAQDYHNGENLQARPPSLNETPAAAQKSASPKRQREPEDADNNSQHSKRSKTSSNGRDPVRYWILHDSWPPNYCTMAPSTVMSPKRQRTPSYPESSRYEGEFQAAEMRFVDEGIVLHSGKGAKHVSSQSLQMCRDMMSRSHNERVNTCVPYPIEKLQDVQEQLCAENKPRIFRDLTPLLVPSVENLTLSGFTELKSLAEDLYVDWRTVKTKGGPVPEPTLTVGLDVTVFDAAEHKKLNNHKAWERPTSFTGKVFFPFLICEVTSVEQGIFNANRQAGHAGALAANAIWQLYHSAETHSASMTKPGEHLPAEIHSVSMPQPGDIGGDLDFLNMDTWSEKEFAEFIKDVPVDFDNNLVGDIQGLTEIDGSQSLTQFPSGSGKSSEISAKQLNGEILAFSVVHDATSVELFGHFPIFNDGDTRPTFYRHLIESQILSRSAESRAQTIRNIVLEIYFNFSKLHLERIQKALRLMPEPKVATLAPTVQPGMDFGLMGPPSESASQMNQRLLEQQVQRLTVEMANKETERQKETDRKEAERQKEAEKKEADLKAEREHSKAERERSQAEINTLKEMLKVFMANKTGN